MTYIKLLTVLTALALLTACGGAAAPTSDNNGEEMSDNDKTDETPDNNGGGNATDCTQTPFHNDCLTNNAPALALRQTMCLADTTIDPTCVGETGIATVFCAASPFDTSPACVADTGAIALRQSMCLTDSTADPSCTGETGVIITFCRTNPFSTETDCTENPNIQDFQFTSCRGGSDDSNCDELLSVNHDDYLASFGDTPPPATVAEAITPRNSIRSFFITVGADGAIDRTGLSNPNNPPDLTRAGDAGDGVTYVRGNATARGSRPHSFVGLLPSTDLGVPLPIGNGQPTMVEWTGLYFNALNSNPYPITFRINFAEGEIDGTDTFENNITIFDLVFNAEGVITGDVHHDQMPHPRDTAEARGLIGGQGLVGGFVNTDGGMWNENLYGGFIADNPTPPPARCIALDNCPANAAAWLRSFTGDNALPTSPVTTNTPRHGFLQGGVATVDFGSLTNNLGNNIGNDPDVRSLNMVPLGGDREDGVAYFEARIGSGTDDGGYAGIFIGTDLGAPLPAYVADTEPIVLWNGLFGAVGDASVSLNENFKLNVNFQTRKINAFVQSSLEAYLKLDGDFNDKGLIVNGKVIYGIFTGGNEAMLEMNIKSGILTGLIGQEGAVGAFHADNTDTEQHYAGGFVAVPPDPCEVNPFSTETACMADTYLPLRVADCITAENTGATKCDTVSTDTAMNTAITACLTNPFATACESLDGFTDFALARTNRVTFCDDTDNVANTLCMGESQMGVCGSNPFNASCFAGATYLPLRVADCITADNVGETRCNNLFTATASNDCLTNPFTDACKMDGAFGTYADMARTKRITFCEIGGNESNALCMGATLTNLCEFNIFSTACTGQPNTPNLRIASCRDANIINKDPSCTEVLLVKENDLPAYPTLPDAMRLIGFLEGTPTGIDTTGFTNRPASRSLNATATAGTGDDMVSLGGLATDGVAWANIDFPDTTNDGYYAGIFSGTNMGAPLVRPATATGAMVEWKGIIRGLGSVFSAIGTATPFTLDVDLFNRTLETYIVIDSVHAFSIVDGTYDAKGLISGTVERGEYSNTADQTTRIATTSVGAPNGNNITGTLTGLIGAKGAVGAFHSNTATSGYAGGFIAVPPPPPSVATHANFKTYYAARTDNRRLLATPTTTGSQVAFVEGTATGLPTDGLTFTGDGQFQPVAIRLKKAATGDDGFALMFGEVTGTGLTRRFRAGLLSGTDLGPAVPTTSTATWAGSLHLAVGTSGVNNVDLPTVSVDFANGTITAPETEVGTGSKVTINGRFGAGLPSGTPAGILGGTVNFDFGGTNQFLNQPLIGLIGTKGVIGVFHGPSNLAAAGGFEATPSE